MRGRPGTRRGSKSAKKSTRSKTARSRAGRAATKKAKAPAKKKAARKTSAAPVRKKSTARKPAARKSTARKSAARKSAAKKTSAKRSTKRTVRPVRKDVFGEGNYTASREFRDQQTDFVRRNKDRIEPLGEEAEAALEGAEGSELEEAENEARSHSHSPEDEG
jgi:hypothetical protein